MIKSQSGRSMVEMLGVLAVIGVLSVGGIAGYTMAMNKYKANEVAQATTMGVVELMTSASIGGQANADISDIKSNVSEIADMTLETANGNTNAYIKLSFDNKDICKQFKNTFTSTSEYVVVGQCAE